MRWVSTPESVRNGEVSALACLETLVAMGIAVWVIWRFDTLVPLAISVMVAPLLLLRTQESMELCARLIEKMFFFFDWLLDWFPDDKRSRKFGTITAGLILAIFILFLVAFVALMPFAIAMWTAAARALSTFRVFLQKPLATFRSIPRNWRRVVLCLDSALLPELVPGTETGEVALPEHKDLVKFRAKEIKRIFSTLRPAENPSLIARLIMLPFVLLAAFMIAVACFPSLAYRLSLKTTSLIYLPIVFLGKGTAAGTRELSLLLRSTCDSELERVQRSYAWFVVVFFTALPITLFIGSQKTTIPWLPTVLNQYFWPGNEIGVWHISRSLAALITLGLFFAASKIKIRYEEGLIKNPDGVLYWMTMASRVRTIASLFTIACGIWLVNKGVDWSDLPGLRWPWEE